MCVNLCLFLGLINSFKTYCKTPLISTYLFSGLATEQVLIFGAVLIFGGMIRRRQKSCKEGVCSIQCFPHTRRCCACFSDYVHTSRIQGYLYSGVSTFGALQPTANFNKNWRGTYFRRGTYLRGFTVIRYTYNVVKISQLPMCGSLWKKMNRCGSNCPPPPPHHHLVFK